MNQDSKIESETEKGNTSKVITRTYHYWTEKKLMTLGPVRSLRLAFGFFVVSLFIFNCFFGLLLAMLGILDKNPVISASGLLDFLIMTYLSIISLPKIRATIVLDENGMTIRKFPSKLIPIAKTLLLDYRKILQWSYSDKYDTFAIKIKMVEEDEDWIFIPIRGLSQGGKSQLISKLSQRMKKTAWPSHFTE